MVNLSRIIPKKPQTGRIEGQYWIWPNNSKTHIRFIQDAVKRYQNLPKGFYTEVERLNLNNLNFLASKAKQLGLKDNVEMP